MYTKTQRFGRAISVIFIIYISDKTERKLIGIRLKMKSYKEWKEENFNEFFGFGKKSPPVQTQIAQQPQMRPGQLYPITDAMNCPFCKTLSVEKRSDYDLRGTKNPYVYQCSKCFKYWNNPDLDPSQAKLASSFVENKLYNLYLAGVVSEDAYLENLDQQNVQQPQNIQQPQNAQNQQQSADINQIANQMQFLPTSKKKLMYQFAQDINNMQPMTYGVAQQQMPVVTMTSDGKETQNTAESNDIIMSGPSGEKYVIKSAKFPKLYVGQIGGPVHPEQGPRNVSVYTGQVPVNFTASWGENMVLKPGDYLVK